SGKRPGEAQFVAIGIGDVEIALAPLGIARRRFGAEARGNRALIKGVDIIIVEDHAAPPRPLPPRLLQAQIEELAAEAETRETCRLAAVQDLKAERAVERDGARHVMRRESDRADARNHCPSLAC